MEKNQSVMPYIAIALLIIIIPICLNYLLQISLPGAVPIIGNDSGASVIWLSFWGSYIAAVGSIFVGYVAIRDNRKVRQQTLIRIELEAKRADYDMFETFILENERLHSIHNLTAILRLLDDKTQIEKARIAQKEWFSLLQNTSSKIVRFYDETEYRKALEAVNKECINLAIAVKEMIENHDERRSLSGFYYTPYEDTYSRLLQAGHKCLIARKKAVDDKFNQLKHA